MLTTFEMDGLFTDEDIENRQTIIMQCRQCRKWTKYFNYNYSTTKLVTCQCGVVDYDPKSPKSIRSYNSLMDSKRKPK